MREYRVIDTKHKELANICCNMCGKEMKINNGIMKEDGLFVEKRWGYFSDKDNEVHRFDMCETCYDKFIASFAIPVEIE